MSHVILKGYNELTTDEENPGFSIVTPTPVEHSSTKIKRWWRKSYKTVTYEGCALINYRFAYIVVSCSRDVELLITNDNDKELEFKVGFRRPGDGNVRRILVVPKEELHNPVNYEDYYFNYETKSFVKVTGGNGSGVGFTPIDDPDEFPAYAGSGEFADLLPFPIDLGPDVTTTPTQVIDLRNPETPVGPNTVVFSHTYDLNPLDGDINDQNYYPPASGSVEFSNALPFPVDLGPDVATAPTNKFDLRSGNTSYDLN